MSIAPRPGIRKMAIVGMGAVGSAFAFAHVMDRAGAQELLLVDADLRRAEGNAMDLQHCLPYGRPMTVSACSVADTTGCDMVVINAGAAQKPGESRIDLVRRNVDIFAHFFPLLSKNNPGALFLIITNPVDVMTRVALKLSGLPPEQIIGTGTVLDTARYRQELSTFFSVDPRNVHAWVLGEHGDSEVLAWSRASIGPYTVAEYGDLTGNPLTLEVRAQIEKEVRTAAYQIIERKGATNFAIGISTQRIFASLSNNQASLATVCRALSGAYGYGDLCLSLPCLLTREGAAAPTALQLSPDEHAAFLQSAEKIDSVDQDLKLGL
jgi:L-lactate dehydrogenase